LVTVQLGVVNDLDNGLYVFMTAPMFMLVTGELEMNNDDYTK